MIIIPTIKMMRAASSASPNLLFNMLFINHSGSRIKRMIHQPKKNFFLMVAFTLVLLPWCNGCRERTPRNDAASPFSSHQESVAQPEISASPKDARSSTLRASPGIDHLTLPSNCVSCSSRRKIIAVHGLGDSPENFSVLFQQRHVSTDVILPRAPTPHGRGGTWFPVAIPVRNTPAIKLQSDVLAATEQLCQFIKKQQFKRKPVITGFSQGGILSYSTAVTCPSWIHAAVPISGFLVQSSLKTQNLPPITALHGTADSLVDFTLDKESIQKLRDAGASARLIEYPGVGHTITDEMHQKWFKILENLIQ